MKKWMAIGGSVVLVGVIVILLLTFLDGIQISEGNKTNKSAASREDSSLTFYETTELSEPGLTNNEGIQYGKYDIFKDGKGKEYYFLHEEDIYCGFLTVNEEYSEGTIEENSAEEIAAEYLKKEVSDSSAYKLEDTMYEDWHYSYLVKFRYYIEEIPTEEVVRISVGGDGKVNSYSNFLVGCFDQTIVDTNTVQEAIETIEEQLENKYATGNYEIDEQCVTYKDGKLVLKTAYHYGKEQENGTSVMMYDTIYTSLR